MDANERGTRGYRTVSPDTDEAADRAYFEALRRLGPEGRALRVRQTLRSSQRVLVAGLRARHPDADEEELRLRAAVLKYGADLVRRAYGRAPTESAA